MVIPPMNPLIKSHHPVTFLNSRKEAKNLFPLNPKHKTIINPTIERQNIIWNESIWDDISDADFMNTVLAVKKKVDDNCNMIPKMVLLEELLIFFISLIFLSPIHCVI